MSSLRLEAPLTVHPSISCQEVVDIMKKEGFAQIPAIDDLGYVIVMSLFSECFCQQHVDLFLSFRCVQGMVTMANLMFHMVNGKVQASDPVSKVLYRQFRKIALETSLSKVSKILETDHFVIVVQTQKQCMY